MRGLLSCAGLVALMAAAGPALAQPADPNINERVRQGLEAISPQSAREDAILTGREDIVLLRRAEIFYVRAEAALNFTDNAALAGTDPQDDIFVVGGIGAGVSTVLAEAVQVYADVGVIASRYDEFETLGYSGVSGSFGANTRVVGVVVGLSYAPSVIYDRKFDVRQLTQHRLGVSLTLPFELQGTDFQASLSGEHVFAKPDDYDAWSVNLALAASREFDLGPLKGVRAFAQVVWSHRDYEHYLPGLLGGDRIDDTASVTGGVQWQAPLGFVVAAHVSHARNWSTSDVNGYRATSGAVALSLRRGF